MYGVHENFLRASCHTHEMPGCISLIAIHGLDDCFGLFAIKDLDFDDVAENAENHEKP